MDLRPKKPANLQELSEYLHTVFRGAANATTEFNSTTGHLVINLDGTLGSADVYLPFAKAKQRAALDLVASILVQAKAGFEPSDADVRRLFDMIDPL